MIIMKKFSSNKTIIPLISRTLLILTLFITSAVQARLNVVTTTQDLAAIAQAIGGEYIKVQSLTPGTRDPHYAEAKPSMIRKVYRADLLLLIGAEMEIGWLPPLLQSSRNTNVQLGGSGYLDLSSSIHLLDIPTGPINRAMGDVHSMGNPHYWLDPRNGIRMSKAISERLSELDPTHSDFYSTQQQAFEKKLAQKLIQWREQLKPLVDKPVIAYHKSFLYLADVFKFNIIAEVEPKPGISPSAGHLNRLVSKIEREEVKLLIMEPYYERRSSRYLNQKTGIKVAVLPQSVESLPEIVDYFALFDGIVASLKKAGGF